MFTVKYMDKDAITVVTPTIPPRGAVLHQNVMSVRGQILQPYDHIIEIDKQHQGAAVTRDRGLRRVLTPWVAFLDDDDIFMPQHLEHLLLHALETEADYVFSWFETLPGGCDPFPRASHYEAPWDPADPRQTTVTTLVRTELAKAVGFLGNGGEETGDGMHSGEDWDFTLGCNAQGKISHLVEKTWYWRHWGYGTPDRPGNTSGQGSRW
jgi:glycosyltransferase involved in cell wall biosynthesis